MAFGAARLNTRAVFSLSHSEVSPDKDHDWFDSPIGRILITSDGHAVTQILFEEESGPALDVAALRRGGPVIELAAAQLRAYFHGTLRQFELPLAPRGTAFQRVVWRALLGIAHGELVSYGEIARRIGKPAASRAVGAANHDNPISIVIPCHRVVGRSGHLVGYGGGLERKAWLIAHERGEGPQPSLFA